MDGVRDIMHGGDGEDVERGNQSASGLGMRCSSRTGDADPRTRHQRRDD